MTQPTDTSLCVLTEKNCDQQMSFFAVWGVTRTAVSEQPPALVREEEFAKQLRLARYLAASSLPPARALEPAVRQARRPKRGRALTKAVPGTKKETLRQKAGEVELAKERRRAGGWPGRRRQPPVLIGGGRNGLRLGANKSNLRIDF